MRRQGERALDAAEALTGRRPKRIFLSAEGEVTPMTQAEVDDAMAQIKAALAAALEGQR